MCYTGLLYNIYIIAIIKITTYKHNNQGCQIDPKPKSTWSAPKSTSRSRLSYDVIKKKIIEISDRRSLTEHLGGRR